MEEQAAGHLALRKIEVMRLARLKLFKRIVQSVFQPNGFSFCPVLCLHQKVSSSGLRHIQQQRQATTAAAQADLGVNGQRFLFGIHNRQAQQVAKRIPHLFGGIIVGPFIGHIGNRLIFIVAHFQAQPERCRCLLTQQGRRRRVDADAVVGNKRLRTGRYFYNLKPLKTRDGIVHTQGAHRAVEVAVVAAVRVGAGAPSKIAGSKIYLAGQAAQGIPADGRRIRVADEIIPIGGAVARWGAAYRIARGEGTVVDRTGYVENRTLGYHGGIATSRFNGAAACYRTHPAIRHIGVGVGFIVSPARGKQGGSKIGYILQSIGAR